MRSLDLDSLRTFLACCEAASFAEAGVWVNKSQSGVSMQMRGLTETIGAPLFERQGRRNVLTAAGQELRGYALRLVRLNDEALGHFRPEGLEGRLRIGTPDDYAEAFLPQVIGNFAHDHPRVEIVIQSDGSQTLAHLVRTGELDLAVVTADPSMAGVEIVHSDPLSWVAPLDRKLEEVRPLPLALWQPGCVWRDMALEALDRAGIECRAAYTGTSVAALAMVVEAGLAVSALPSRSCAPGMRHIAPGVLPPLGSFDVGIMRSETRPKALADAFAAEVAKAFSRHAAASQVPEAA